MAARWTSRPKRPNASVPGSGKLTLILYHAVIDAPGPVHAEYPDKVLEREVELKPNQGEPAPSHLALHEIPASIVRQRDVIAQLEERLVAHTGMNILTGQFDRLTTAGWHEETKNLQFQRYQLYRMQTEPPAVGRTDLAACALPWWARRWPSACAIPTC